MIRILQLENRDRPRSRSQCSREPFEEAAGPLEIELGGSAYCCLQNLNLKDSRKKPASNSSIMMPELKLEGPSQQSMATV